MTRFVVALSGGDASWLAGRIAVDTYGPENGVAVFADVQGDSPHEGEHPDTYRALEDFATDLGVELVRVRDGRGIWEVFLDHGQLGNAYRAHCSTDLKVLPTRRWLAEHRDPADTVVVMGLGWTEMHRVAPVHRGYAHTEDGCANPAWCRPLWDDRTGDRLEGPGCRNLLPVPWRVWLPLTERPTLYLPWQVKDMLTARGLKSSAMYREGFAHANCVFCVKGGKTHQARVYRRHPDRYTYAVQREEEFRASRPTRARYTIMNDGYVKLPDGSKRKIPLTLREFGERIAAADQAALPFGEDEDDEGGCGCFTDGDPT